MPGPPDRRQLGQRRPAAGARELLVRHAPPRREVGQLGGRERQVRLAEPDDLSGDIEPGERHRRRGAPREHDVPVPGEGRQHRGDHVRSGRTRRDEVHVVEDDGHLGGRPVPDALGERARRRPRAWAAARRPCGSAQPLAERGGRVVVGCAAEPDVDRAGRPRRCRRSPGRGGSSCRSRREPRRSRSAARTARAATPRGVRVPPGSGAVPAARSGSRRRSGASRHKVGPAGGPETATSTTPRGVFARILASDGRSAAERGDLG